MDAARAVLKWSDPEWRPADAVDASGVGLLHSAIAQGRPDLVQLLLEFGADVDLRDHPGFAVLESEEVKRVGLRARPLDPDAPLKPGKLYFLVDLPRADPEPDYRRAGAGAARSY
ncbi:uncharacterized protein LOC109727112 [Ananas comosus]|uniref:Uncharacterized protein LOC109727112 n=1 Tax=Ananas comosus TaxID=4615 RepID=A0A6P5H3L3_ANACO|nr:uncharacterized protein LOC109727112 [Ananas comosus]